MISGCDGLHKISQDCAMIFEAQQSFGEGFFTDKFTASLKKICH